MNTGTKPASRAGARALLLERLEDRLLLNAAAPVAALDLPSQEFINEALDFAVSFDNAAAPGPDSTGFAPYVDVLIPADIDASGISASYLGNAVVPLAVATFDGSQWLAAGEPLVEHPLTGVALDGADALTAGAVAGDQLLIIQLPFGSFTADQPVARLEFSGALLGGQVDVAETISTRGGFAFGCDEFDNPLDDVPLQQAPVSASITPQVIELSKVVDASEGESATGPNFPLTFTLSVDIASGETVNALQLADVLPAGTAWLDNLAFVQGGAPVVLSAPLPAGNAPGLLLDYGEVIGVPGIDIVVTYQLYLTDVIADDDGDDNDDAAPANPFLNNAAVDGLYDGNPVGDTDDETVIGKLLAVQKGVSLTTDPDGNGVSPGDTLSYTLDFQVSDFTGFSAIVLDDVLGNGQVVDTGFAPTFSFTENGVVTSGVFGLTSAINAPFTGNVTQSDLGGGLTRLLFDVSQELIDRGQDGTLAGDPLSGATTGTVTFRARVLEEFAAPGPGPDLSVDINDVLGNDVTVSGVSSGGDTESDSSAASVSIDGLTLGKSIFAVDGDTAFDPAAGLNPGQAVTYRIRLELPTADIENLVVTDFLPLPVFDATSVSVFDAGFPSAGTPPAAGVAAYGPDHNLNTQTFTGGIPNNPPLLVSDAQSNILRFDFGTFDAAPPAGTVIIDLLFTATLLDKPFGEGLLLTNQSVSQYGNTGGQTVSNTEIVQVRVNEPSLSVSKGVVAASTPAAVFDAPVGPTGFNAPGTADPLSGSITSTGLFTTPVDANVSGGVDAGDILRFALVVENSGGASAFDILLRDTLPAGFQLPAGGLNLQVRTGDDAATPVGFTSVGAGLFSGVAGEGIRIDDDVDGILAAAEGAPGSNVLVVTYDLQVVPGVNPATLHQNTVLLERFAAREGGTDFTDGFEREAYTDTASVVTATPGVAKQLVGSDRAFTDASDLAIGEIATFDIVVTLPEGELSDLVVTDLLPAGMAYLAGSARLVTAGADADGLDADFAGSVNLVSAVSAGTSGADIVFTLDDGAGGAVITNADNNAANNRFVLRFEAEVLDEPGNSGLAPQTTLSNRARLDYTDVDGVDNAGIASAGAAITSGPVLVTLVEPLLDIAKDIDRDSVDAGDVVTVTLTLSNSGTADAFDIVIEDVLDPLRFTNVIAGAAPPGFVDTSAGNTVRYAANPGFALAEGAPPVVFTFTAEVTANIVPGEVLTNTATITGGNTLPAGGRDVFGDTGTDTTQVTLGLAKSIVASSEAHTGDGQVAVGEILRYRLEIELPEASATGFTLQDLLLAGLRFIDPHASLDGSVRIAFVSDGGLSSSGALGTADAAAFVIGDEASLAGITPVFELADANVSTDPDNDIDGWLAGDDVYFRLGDITNADADDNAEFIVIEFNALVANEAGNIAGASLANSVRALSDDNGPNTPIGADSAPVAVTVVEPDVSIAKAITTPAVDAGDEVVYTITVSNAAGANVASAFDIRVLDDLDALDAGALSLVSAVFDPGTSAAAVASDATAGNVLDLTIDRLDPGEAITITVTATLAADLQAGRSVDNLAAVSATSLPGPSGTAVNPTGSALAGVAGAPDGERDGSGGVNDYSATAASGFTAPLPAIDKQLTDPGVSNVDIGAIVQYDILVTLPEGRTDDLRILDAVPDGMAVAAAELITGAAGSAVLAEDFSGTIENAGAIATVAAQGNGVDLVLDLGDVDVTATPGSAGGSFVVRVTTVVLNDPATSGFAGTQTTLVNGASLTWLDPDDGPGGSPQDASISDPDDPVLTVVEPELSISKSVLTAAGGSAGDAGDSATWTIAVAHTARSTGTARDLDLADTLPAQFLASGFSATIAAPGDATALFDLAGNVLSTVGDLDLAPGETLTIVIDGTLADSIRPGAALQNSVTLDYSSADGDVSDTLGGPAGPADPEDDERVRSIGDSAVVDVPAPVFDKVLLGSDEPASEDGLGEATIGETLTFGIVFTLPEGSYGEIIIDDAIAPGLQYVGGSATLLAPAGYAGSLPGISVVGGAAPGADITLTLASPFTVAGDNDPANNGFTISYQAVVVDAGNSGLAGAQSVLDNQASVTLDDPANPGTPLSLDVAGQPGVTTATVSLSVVEPLLSIDKTSVVTRADAGDVVTWTITVSHAPQSTGAAFDLVITDDLLGAVLPAVPPDKIDLVADPAVSTGAGTVTIGGAPGDQEIRVEVERFDRDAAPIVITYSALLNGNVNAAGDSVTNTARLSWDSHGGSPAEQRTAIPVSDDFTLLVPLTTPEVDKAVIATSLAHTGTARLDPAVTDLVVGETVTWRLVATFNEGAYGAAVDATIADQLPDFLALVGAPRILTGGAGGVGMNVTLIGSDITLADNTGDGVNDFFSINLDLASVAVDPANPALVHDQVWIEYDAIVQDIDDGVNNRNAGRLTNTASLTFDPAGAAVLTTATADVEILEPQLQVSKQASLDRPNPGDVITYTLTVSHAPGPDQPDGSGMTAYDLVIDDALAPRLTLVPGSVSVVETPAGFASTGLSIDSGNAPGDTAVRVTADSLVLLAAPEGRLIITYDAMVSPEVGDFGALVTNTATVAWDGIPGDDPGQRRAQADGSETVRIVGADLSVSKDDGLAAAAPGDTITWAITVTNLAAPLGDPANADDATDVLVVDTLPQGVSFISSADATFAGFDPATRELRWLIPFLAAGTSANLSVDVSVDAAAPAGVETLVNTVTVSSPGIDPTPADNTAGDSTALLAAPDLSISKSDGLGDVAPGDRIDWTITVSNNGNQASSGVTVTDNWVPGRFEAVSATRPPGVAGVIVDEAAGTVTWQIPLLAPGETLVLGLGATLANPLPAGVESVTNSVSVTDDGRSGPDANPGDEIALDTNTVSGAAPDYVIAKSNGSDTLLPGRPVTWAITVSNVGNQGGTGVVITDSYDTGLLRNVVASDGGVVDPLAGTVSWQLASLAGGEAVTVTLTGTLVQVPPAGQLTAANTATVSDDGSNGADPTPDNNRVIDVDALQVFVYDALRDDSLQGGRGSAPWDAFFGRDAERARWLEPLPVDALFTGHADPHSTLVITLFNEAGDSIGRQVVIADAGGNWVASFAGTVVSGQPHAISVGHASPGHAGAEAGAFNLRTYFSPALHGPLFHAFEFSPEMVSDAQAGARLEAMSAANRDPLHINWHGQSSYEFIASSSTTTQYVN